MADRKNRIDTSKLFEKIISAGDTRDIANDKPSTEESSSKKPLAEEPIQEKTASVMAKPTEEKVRVTFYLPKDTNKELSIQSAMKNKEKDRTAIVEAAVSLLLALEPDVYSRLKATAEITGRPMGSVVNDALKSFL